MSASRGPGATHLKTLLLVSCLLLLATSLVLAQSGGGYDLSWNTVDGGGGVSQGGAYAVSGTAGQIDAGLMSGGPYVLGGGFWGGGELHERLQAVYVPLVVRER